MRILVKTLGSVSARSASSSATQPVMASRPFSRICTTSYAVHPPAPISISSIGLMVLLPPPGASARPRVSRWPLPDSPTNIRSSTQVMRAFMIASPPLETARSLSLRRQGLQCAALAAPQRCQKSDDDEDRAQGQVVAVDAVDVHDRDCWFLSGGP